MHCAEHLSLTYWPHWINGCDAGELFCKLTKSLDWQTHQLYLFGQWRETPRLVIWMGDARCQYSYSGVKHYPTPWHPDVLQLCQRLNQSMTQSFNSVLLNFYRDGHDSMGWHRDNEASLGRTPLIASVSLGASRPFMLRYRYQPKQTIKINLAHGSLLMMDGDTQQYYEHALPKRRGISEPRLNLTFRRITDCAQP